MNILVIGDLMIDHYINGDCNRISPEAPVPVVEVTHESHTLGGAGNVLNNLVAFNCRTSILSVTGKDDGAATVVRLLAECGVPADHIVADDSRCTTIKSRVLAVNHQLIRLDREVTTPITESIQEQLITRLQEIVNDQHLVLLSDYNKGVLTAPFIQRVVGICREAGVRILVDPKGLDFTKYCGVDLIKPNKKEAAAATGIKIDNNEALEQACKKLMEVTQCKEVVVTLSEQGIALYTNEKLTIIPTRTMSVIDVTGAGDTVLAALGLYIASGRSLYEACVFANQAAAVVVSKVGSATTTVDEISERSQIHINQ